MSQVGRISGPLLTANLERRGTVNPASQSNLSFRDTLSTTPLLFLDVVNDRIAVNNNVAGTDYKLDVDGTTQTVYLIGDTASIADFTITDSTFNALGSDGNLYLDAADTVVLSTLDNGNIVINDNNISTTVSNSDIDLFPYGSGELKVFNDLEVFGNIDATGNITLEGDITFGDSSTIDTVTIEANIDSNVIPNNDNLSLGSTDKRWNELHTAAFNGELVFTGSLIAGGIDTTTVVGNVFYVSVNGNDSNKGDHVLAPFATIEHALAQADGSTAGPVTIHVAPGDYQENLPLVVPNNVSIIGSDTRNTIIRPTTAHQSDDIFHLNGETLLSNLTIKEFYYDSINDTGYAFRFAPNGITNTRSPYIQNVTVLTDESSPGAGDAGRGALIDGAELDVSSNEASMLFHSCTFILKDADAIRMTNGVRVEWLNSFTYFANRGLYAYNGVTGRTSPDGSTVVYGAEVRSIGSANVYGNYGAVADGADCLMYLIQHNFAYVGAGINVDNDNSLAIQANEVVELNSGRIQYVTTDHTGAFRVGDNFFVDFETGESSFNVDDVETAGFTNIIIQSGSDVTTLDVNKVQTGNVRFSGNTIDSVALDLTFDATTEANINSNVSISDNLDITGNLSFGGTSNIIGDAPSDTLDLNVGIDQNFNPGIDSTYNLASLNYQWQRAWLSQVDVGDIKIFDNVVTTDISNADLELRASSTGEVLIPNNDVQLDNNLTVSGNTDLQDVSVTGTVTQTGNYNITGNISVTNLNITNILDISSQAQFEEILFDGNVITTTTTNADLELRANGIGEVLIPNNNVRIENNLSADDINTYSDYRVVLDTTFNLADVSDVTVTQNYITSNTSNADLELRASGTGEVLVPNNDIQIDNDLTVSGNTDLQDLTITGLLDQTGNRTQVGNYNQTGDTIVNGNVNIDRVTQFEDIKIDGNVVSTTLSNSDLDLRANGTGEVVLQENVIVNNDLSANNITSGNINIDADLVLDDIVVTSNIIQINDNYISTTISNANLELRASGTGILSIESNDVTLEQNLTVNGDTDIDSVDITGDITQTGNRIQTGNIDVNGDVTVSSLTLDRGIELSDIRFDGNVVETKVSNADLDLRAAGTGEVLIPNNNVNITNDLSAGSMIDVESISVTNDVAMEILELSTDIQLFDNVITTTNSNSNLELRTSGTGDIRLQEIDFNNNVVSTKAGPITLGVTNNLIIDGTGAFTVTKGTSVDRTNVQGDFRFNTDYNVFEGYNTSNIGFMGVYSDDKLTKVTVNNSDDIQMFVNGYTEDSTAQVAEVNGSGLRTHGLQVDDILFDNNTIATNVSNANLDLVTNGTGSIVVDNITLKGNTLTNTASGEAFQIGGTGQQWVVFEGNAAIKFPAGPDSTRPASPVLGQTRVNTDSNELETWVGDQWRTSAGEFASISEAQMEEEAFVQTLIYG